MCIYIYIFVYVFSVEFFHTSHVKTNESSLLSQSVPFIFILYFSVRKDKDEQISLKSITQFLSVSYGQLLMFIHSVFFCVLCLSEWVRCERSVLQWEHSVTQRLWQRSYRDCQGLTEKWS